MGQDRVKHVSRAQNLKGCQKSQEPNYLNKIFLKNKAKSTMNKISQF